MLNLWVKCAIKNWGFHAAQLIKIYEYPRALKFKTWEPFEYKTSLVFKQSEHVQSVEWSG